MFEVKLFYFESRDSEVLCVCSYRDAM